MNRDNKDITCPYCQNNMMKGAIRRDRYALKWVPNEDNKNIFSALLCKGIVLDGGIMGKGFVDANYCRDCKKIIIDVEESIE